ncbi:MAG TPA: hypothetical protein VE673_19060, partial [Pseudonocardiaceae bacterium]|nr:hypothetical protein [Pseudonocardiaceae bacterium]
GEPIDDQIGDVRAGRLVLGDIDAPDPSSDYWPMTSASTAPAPQQKRQLCTSSLSMTTTASIHLTTALRADEPWPQVRAIRCHTVEIDAAANSTAQSTDSLDDLAAFLMHHAYQPAVTDAERLHIFAVVDAYQEGDKPSAVESAMRSIALRFGEYPDYRPEWRPRPASST